MNEKHVFIIGSKGIPAKYGGFETFVENLTARRVNENIKYHVACMEKDDKEFDSVKYMGHHRHAFAELNNMYMTGKDIDAVIKRVSFTVSEGINIAVSESFMDET